MCEARDDSATATAAESFHVIPARGPDEQGINAVASELHKRQAGARPPKFRQSPQERETTVGISQPVFGVWLQG
jgi:hypothetical protein